MSLINPGEGLQLTGSDDPFSLTPKTNNGTVLVSPTEFGLEDTVNQIEAAVNTDTSFESYYRMKYGHDPYSLLGNIQDWLYGYRTSAKNEYDYYFNLRQQALERQYEADMNRYMRSTEFQDTVKGLEAAGLNPYAMLSLGGATGVSNWSPSSNRLERGSTAKKSSGLSKGAIAALLYLIGRILFKK